jgi:pyruvate-formate lyase-activating enzyme
VIPGFNDDAQSRSTMLGYLQDLHAEIVVELLPFHNLGRSKYDALARKNEYEDIASFGPQDLMVFKQEGDRMGLNVRIGSI